MNIEYVDIINVRVFEENENVVLFFDIFLIDCGSFLCYFDIVFYGKFWYIIRKECMKL